jgi:hypothetical protein
MIYSLSLYIGNDFLKYVKKIDELTKCMGKRAEPLHMGRYAAGQRRCQVCAIFIKWNGIWCPCCSYRLRKNPRKTEDKVKLRQSEKVKELGLEPTLNAEVAL